MWMMRNMRKGPILLTLKKWIYTIAPSPDRKCNEREMPQLQVNQAAAILLIWLSLASKRIIGRAVAATETSLGWHHLRLLWCSRELVVYKGVRARLIGV